MSLQCSPEIPDEDDKILNLCVCCLRKDVALIKLITCRHVGLFSKLFHYKTRLTLKWICWHCHALLVKTIAFKKQVESSIKWLNKAIDNPKAHWKVSPHKQIFSLECTPIKTSSIDENQSTPHVKDKLTNHNTEIWFEEAKTNKTGENWTDEQPLAAWAEYPAKEEELSTHEEVDLPIVIKHEIEDSDIEEDVPLSDINVTADLLDCTAETSHTSKPNTGDKYDGKVTVVSLSKEEYLLEKERERTKEAYLKLPFRCEDCVMGFDYDVTLQEHMEKRHGKKDGSFVCKLCKSVLATIHSYKEHNRRHLRRYECSECGKRYNTMHAAVEHYKEQHGAIVTAFTCEQCGFTTDSNRRYRYHRDKHKAKPQCAQCGKTFVNKSGLRVHNLTQHKKNKEMYVCSYKNCNKMFSTKSGLRSHLASVHKSTGAYCYPCRTHFKCASTLRHHLMTHSAHLSKEDWKFVCDECGEKFLLKSALREHIDWLHLGKTTHQCEQCAKVYKSARSLLRHREYVHDKKRPPKNKICDHCGKGFTTLSILRTHVRTHTGERPLSCSHCPATFAHPAALYTHNKLLHAKNA